MQRPGRKCFYAFCIVAIVYILLCLIGVQITKDAPGPELQENQEWVATGRFWLDREICRWFGFCGLFHMVNTAGWTWPHSEDGAPPLEIDYSGFWKSDEADPDSWSRDERRMREIPQYVLDHAPYVHLFSGEEFWPSDIAEHLEHVTAFVNHTDATRSSNEHRNLTDLRDLDQIPEAQGGKWMYLRGDDNSEERPMWLVSARNIPSAPVKEDPDASWPDVNDLNAADLEALKQQALTDFRETSAADDSAMGVFDTKSPSTDGRCGGNSGLTCTGSRFGKCCSIYGWCGGSEAYCGDPCDPLAGTCYDPFAPPQGPRTDLRKRSTDDAESVQKHQSKPASGGRSSAPAFLIVVPKDDGVVDAFWFFFYSFNLGQKVFNIRFGNHVGDWEHTAIRFKNGKPYHIFLSEHNFGAAYTWKAIEKYLPAYDGSGTMIGSWSNATASRMAKRPVVYSAIGSHAMYGTPGLHPYVLPFGLLHDETDRGPLWDPSLNLQSYTYSPADKTLRASVLNPHSPTGWFDFSGHWGDKYLQLGDPRQYRLAGQYHYVNGPLGPKFKNLGRTTVCQNVGKKCEVKAKLASDYLPRTLLDDDDEGEEGGLPGGNHTDEATGWVDLR